MKRVISDHELQIFLDTNNSFYGRNFIEKDDFMSVFRDRIERHRNFPSTLKDDDFRREPTQNIQFEDQVNEHAVHNIFAETIKKGHTFELKRQVSKVANQHGDV